LLGSGDPALEAAFQDAARHYPGRLGVHFGYEERLAHLVQAGADALLIPSRFEPCGLTQLCAMRYGAVPVVARVGGLADTIVDANEMALQSNCATGLQFAPVSAEALAGALRKAAALYARKPVWRKLQANGLKTDVSWTHPARRYADIYRAIAPASVEAAA
jgi:starch synthase